MKVTKEIKGYIKEWLGYDDEDNYYMQDQRVKGLHCPYLTYLNTAKKGSYTLMCENCRKAFGVTIGCPCKRLGVKAVVKRAKEILELKEI